MVEEFCRVVPIRYIKMNGTWSNLTLLRVVESH